MDLVPRPLLARLQEEFPRDLRRARYGHLLLSVADSIGRSTTARSRRRNGRSLDEFIETCLLEEFVRWCPHGSKYFLTSRADGNCAHNMSSQQGRWADPIMEALIKAKRRRRVLDRLGDEPLEHAHGRRSTPSRRLPDRARGGPLKLDALCPHVTAWFRTATRAAGSGSTMTSRPTWTGSTTRRWARPGRTRSAHRRQLAVRRRGNDVKLRGEEDYATYMGRRRVDRGAG